jgi:hypothetical protein
VTSLRVLSISSARSVIVVIEIGGGSTGGCSRSGFINLTIEFAGATSANEAGKEEKDGDYGDDTDGGEDPGNRACIVEETKTIVSPTVASSSEGIKSYQA